MKIYNMSKEITSYQDLFEEIIQAIESARVKAYKSLTQHQMALNFEIGRLIVVSQERQKWGKSVVDNRRIESGRIWTRICGKNEFLFGSAGRHH